jgi:dipeptide/tripeptide permease
MAYYRANCVDGQGLLYLGGPLDCDSADNQDAVLRLDALIFLALVGLLYWLFYKQAKSNLRLKRKP